MLRRSQSSVQQFEIQLQGNSGRNEDIILLSGPPLEAAASHLTGQLVLNTLDTSSIRKITLKLVGTLRLRWPDSGAKSSQQTLPTKFEKQLFQTELTDFDIPGRLVSAASAATKINSKATPGGSLTNLASYFKHNRRSSSTENLSTPASPAKLSSLDRSPIISRAASSVNFQELRNPQPAPGSPNHASSSTKLANGAKTSQTINSATSPHPLTKSSSSLNKPNNASSTGSNQVHQVPPGNYRFPFDIYIPGDLDESIEGNRYVQHAYYLVATVERGLMQPSLTAKKHVRVVRTVGVDSYDVAHTVSIGNTWPKKVEYKIWVPNRATAFGSELEIQFALVPLDKGLKLGGIRAEIVEYVTVSPPLNPSREEEQVVARQFFDVPPNFDHMSDEWEIMHCMDAPRSLSKATQDATLLTYAKIVHKFRCFISLINADGHTSELRASLPITLYISPHAYVMGNADPELANQRPLAHKRQSTSALNLSTLGSLAHHPTNVVNHHNHHNHTRQSSNLGDEPMFNVDPPPLHRTASVPPPENSAPPSYSHRVYDRLYSTLNSPAESPVVSSPSTPHLSRAPSPVNMNNLDAHQQAQLSAGLRSLAMSRQNSHQSHASLSRNPSAVELAALSRVPSYDEAINEQAAGDVAPHYTD